MAANEIRQENLLILLLHREWNERSEWQRQGAGSNTRGIRNERNIFLWYIFGVEWVSGNSNTETIQQTWWRAEAYTVV